MDATTLVLAMIVVGALAYAVAAQFRSEPVPATQNAAEQATTTDTYSY